MWLEELPSKCPPNDAEEKDLIAFRIVDTIPPQINDFYSKKKIFPEKVFPNIDECTIRACSIFDNVEECKKQRKYPYFRNKKIVKVTITKSDGVIKKTFGDGHYSWWLWNSFMPNNSNTEAVNE